MFTEFLPIYRWQSVIVVFGRGLGVAPSLLMGSAQILTDNDDDLEDGSFLTMAIYTFMRFTTKEISLRKMHA